MTLKEAQALYDEALAMYQFLQQRVDRVSVYEDDKYWKLGCITDMAWQRTWRRAKLVKRLKQKEAMEVFP